MQLQRKNRKKPFKMSYLSYKNLHEWYHETLVYEIDGLVQDCSNSIANTLELLQSCIKPSKWLGHKPIPRPMMTKDLQHYVNGKEQDCHLFIANSLEIPKLCTNELNYSSDKSTLF